MPLPLRTKVFLKNASLTPFEFSKLKLEKPKLFEKTDLPLQEHDFPTQERDLPIQDITTPTPYTPPKGVVLPSQKPFRPKLPLKKEKPSIN